MTIGSGDGGVRDMYRRLNGSLRKEGSKDTGCEFLMVLERLVGREGSGGHTSDSRQHLYGVTTTCCY